MIGAGPAGPHLCVAGRGAQHRSRCSSATTRAGGAFRYAGKAPLFQDVVANQESFDRYVRAAGRGLRARRASTFRYGIDVTRAPDLLAPFDRIVIATGARYRFGLGRFPRRCSTSAPAAGRACDRFSRAPTFRDWFYERARAPTGDSDPRGSRVRGSSVIVIGDALTRRKKHGRRFAAHSRPLARRDDGISTMVG